MRRCGRCSRPPMWLSRDKSITSGARARQRWVLDLRVLHGRDTLDRHDNYGSSSRAKSFDIAFHPLTVTITVCSVKVAHAGLCGPLVECLHEFGIWARSRRELFGRSRQPPIAFVGHMKRVCAIDPAQSIGAKIVGRIAGREANPYAVYEQLQLRCLDIWKRRA
jgi:hypothetical protein